MGGGVIAVGATLVVVLLIFGWLVVSRRLGADPKRQYLRSVRDVRGINAEAVRDAERKRRRQGDAPGSSGT
jgi:hypothetical protein